MLPIITPALSEKFLEVRNLWKSEDVIALYSKNSGNLWIPHGGSLERQVGELKCLEDPNMGFALALYDKGKAVQFKLFHSFAVFGTSEDIRYTCYTCQSIELDNLEVMELLAAYGKKTVP